MKKPGLNSGKTEAANGYSQQSLNKLHRTQYINIDYTHHRHQKELTRNRICDINMYIYIYMYVCMYISLRETNKKRVNILALQSKEQQREVNIVNKMQRTKINATRGKQYI